MNGKQLINTILDSNKPINSVVDFFAKGAQDIRHVGKRALSEEHTFESAVNSVYKKASGEVGKDGKEIMKWDKGRVATSAVTGAVGLRALGGGGLYRDRHGNNDIIGIPGI